MSDGSRLKAKRNSEKSPELAKTRCAPTIQKGSAVTLVKTSENEEPAAGKSIRSEVNCEKCLPPPLKSKQQKDFSCFCPRCQGNTLRMRNAVPVRQRRVKK